MNLKNALYGFAVIAFVLNFTISCTRGTSPRSGFSMETSPLMEYFPVNPQVSYVYKVDLEDQSHERTLKWRPAGEKRESPIYALTDGKDFTKVYEFSADSVTLRGITLFEEVTPQLYQGVNPCLRLPLKVGNKWEIDALLKTPATVIHQTGWGRIVRNEKIEVQAGTFDAIKVLFNVTSEYRVKNTDEKSYVTAQFAIWYGKGVGMALQKGAAFIEKESRTVTLNQELIQCKM
ncbi:hypothetical protein JW926_03875 [Candidatus Sumerlaeota bacterium]|nr:hypothetical protein [Candidatus Sumerlaeota bacterium]